MKESLNWYLYNLLSSICNKDFKFRSIFSKHLRIHTGERPFLCKVENCDQRFSQMSNLKRHNKTHFGIKPFECKKCLRKYSSFCNLSQHLMIHEFREGRRKLKCIIEGCDSSYFYLFTLKIHLLKSHRTQFNQIQENFKDKSFKEIFDHFNRLNYKLKCENVCDFQINSDKIEEDPEITYADNFQLLNKSYTSDSLNGDMPEENIRSLFEKLILLIINLTNNFSTRNSRNFQIELINLIFNLLLINFNNSIIDIHEVEELTQPYVEYNYNLITFGSSITSTINKILEKLSKWLFPKAMFD